MATGTIKRRKKGKDKQEKIKLLEGTAYKFKENKPGKERVPVYIKKEHLIYEEELKKLQIELMKLQKQIKKDGMRVLTIFEHTFPTPHS